MDRARGLARDSRRVWLVRPDIGHYRGLSGLDSALAATAALTILTRRDASWALRLGGAAGLGGLVVKITFEAGSGATLFLDTRSSEIVAVPLAHAVGVMVGLACGAVPPKHVDDIVIAVSPSRSCRS